MKHELKKLEHSAVEISITLTADEFLPVKNEIVKKIAKEVEIPGFRKGHAPLDKVEATFADKIKADLADKILAANLNSIASEEKLNLVSYPYNVDVKMDDSFEVTFKIDVYPEVTLGNYKGVEVEKENFELTDDVLAKEIDAMLSAKGSLIDAPEGHKAAMGDTVDLAFEGFVDGVAFEGGKSDSHQLKLGSKMFIDTFEDQLVGYTVGQEGEVNVTFPEQYHAANLAGKPATFKVKINAIKTEQKPELTEEFAKEAGFESVEDLKAKKSAEITEREETRIKNMFIGKLVQKIVSESKVDVPKSMVFREVENRIFEMNEQLKMQGLDYDKYLSMVGLTQEQSFNQLAPMALNKIQVDLVLEAIAKAENIEVSDEDMAKRTEEIAKMYGMDTAKLEEELNKNNNLDNFKNSLRNELKAQKAVDFIVANAK